MSNTETLTPKFSGPKKINLGHTYRRFAEAIGLGVITGAADDDPSGIANPFSSWSTVRNVHVVDRIPHLATYGSWADDVRPDWDGDWFWPRLHAAKKFPHSLVRAAKSGASEARTAVVNGLLAPFLLVGILLVACDSKIMNQQPSSMLGRIMVSRAIVIMFAAAVAMFIT